MRPHRRPPTRLLCPWDSPDKNTGVGCHFLLQCMKVKSESEVAQSCPTPATPWTAAHQAPPSIGFSRQEYWSGVPLLSSIRQLDNPITDTVKPELQIFSFLGHIRNQNLRAYYQTGKMTYPLLLNCLIHFI